MRLNDHKVLYHRHLFTDYSLQRLKHIIVRSKYTIFVNTANACKFRRYRRTFSVIMVNRIA